MGSDGVAVSGRYDETTGGTSDAVLPGWADLVAGLESVDSGLAGLSGLVDRLLEDDGVTYTPVSRERRSTVPPQRWRLDPVPLLVEPAQWRTLEAGLLQRSTLLDALLTDLYSARSVLTRGLLPAELVFEHEHYLRQAHGITIPGAHQLFFHAVDVARRPDGSFEALGDRTQAPSGAGYAMADRRVMARVLPELFRRSAPRGLGHFFHSILGSLHAVAPNGVENPRVVVLSPGTHSETAFDQAQLASLLGLPLVESADLTVRGGRLLMRALGRYEPVDVVVRRVDAAWSDPLDLRPDSRLGVAGLTEACRRGTVTVVNTLGSGILENPGLLPYLPVLARELLGEDLQMASVPTFWCGEQTGRSHVLAHFDDMVLRPTGTGEIVVPAALPAAERSAWRERIAAEPTRWVGQQRATFSCAPVVEGDALAPARVGLRLFTVAHQSGYVAMAGGLGRIVADTGPGSAASRESIPSGPSIAKDVWVRSVRADVAPAGERFLDDSRSLVEPVGMAAAASPRVLEDLFWLGRYAERTEDLTRLLITERELADTYRFKPYDAGAGSVAVLIAAVSAVSAAYPELPDGADPVEQMRRLVLDATTPGTVAQSLAGLQETARAVRDQLSSDTWMVLAGVDRALAELAAAPGDAGAVLQSTHAAILSGMLALSGLASENMVRDPGWRLMDTGRRLERGQQLAALLRATLTSRHPGEVESIVIESVLAVAESGLTYRRRYRGNVQVGTVLELLLLDPGNPRSLAYQVHAIAENLRQLPTASGTSRPERLTEELIATLRRARPAEMDDVAADGGRPDLAEFLTSVHDSLRNLADAVATAHFWRSRPMLALGQQLPAVGRPAPGAAAMTSARYRIEHRTAYRYSDSVSASYGRGYLRPRELPWQSCEEHSLVIDPAPSDAAESTDVYGNVDSYFHVTTSHTELTVTGVSVVQVHRPEFDAAAAGRPWEEARFAGPAGELVEFLLASPYVQITEEVRAYAAESFRPGRPGLAAVVDLMHRINTDFTYSSGATKVGTPVAKVLASRAGVCQDFAHLIVACARSHGVPARYVSGYLATRPPPGRPRLVGVDASHAWAALLLPGGHWLAVDPTNDTLADERYTTVGWGRDYGDVPPLRGVIFTEARTSSMDVAVDVAPL